MRRLKAHDRYLDLEELGSHLAVVDTRKIISYRKYDLGGAIKYTPTYQRILHLAPGQALDGAVINEIKMRDMNRWQRAVDWQHHIEKQHDSADDSRQKASEALVDDLTKEGELMKRRIPGVVIDGYKEARP